MLRHGPRDRMQNADRDGLHGESERRENEWIKRLQSRKPKADEAVLKSNCPELTPPQYLDYETYKAWLYSLEDELKNCPRFGPV